MLSKLFQRTCRSIPVRLLIKPTTTRVCSVRTMMADLVPPNQYDTPIPNKLRIGYAMRVYWETIPLFVTVAISLGILFFSIAWACQNKVDAVFSVRSRNNISRTMDLRNPTIHKLRIINQRYEPWPEMQDVLDKMKMAEKRALVRAQSCNQA